jgi:hypothetical protein
MTNPSELLEQLTRQGIQVSANHDKLNIRSPKGAITPELHAELAARKAEILAWLQEVKTPCYNPQVNGLSLSTIGGLIGGFNPNQGEEKPPIINPLVMAQQLSVTFRPLPPGYKNQTIIQFREKLEQKLRDYQVNLIPWEEATTEFNYKVDVPLTKWQKRVKTRLVKAEVSAVIDVERPTSFQRRAKNFVAETLYQGYSRLVWKQRKLSIPRIARVIGWAEEGAAKYVENPTNTQVIVLTELDQEFIQRELPYQRKIELGLNTLIRTLSELVIGISEDQISILNMNLSDSIFGYDQLDRFVLNSLIPKIFVPILPLPISKFKIEKYNPQKSVYAKKLVDLGQMLAVTGLLPPGSQLSKAIKRKSHRDIVNVIVDGRTGVSYGFVAYLEPPQYVGEREISATEWETLQPVAGFSSEEVRCNNIGRRYLQTQVGEETRYKQIPDLWLVSSRSGSNKTNLNQDQDILRIGMSHQLMLQLPPGIDLTKADVKPSYDVYVMIAIALSAALYAPHLIEKGAPLIHFHGYPAHDWFTEGETYCGIHNPSVPCGTYESGVLNFLGIQNLALSSTPVNLVALIEPDHGTNIIAADEAYLLSRLKAGLHQKQIELGGKYFFSLCEQ